MDNFYKMMEVLKTDWDTRYYNIDMVQMLARGLATKSDSVSVEGYLRDALKARRLGTQLSQGMLQKLKVQAA